MIRHSQEDYLEAILVLGGKGAVRSVDIAGHLGFSKPSVSRAVSHMVKAGLVHMDSDKLITLTEKGRTRAEHVYEKHVFFKDMLLMVGVEEPMAAQEACRIEHAISDESFASIKRAYETGCVKSVLNPTVSAVSPSLSKCCNCPLRSARARL